jgi:cytochrome c biogenesis protein CcmG/thiol:disulfide interchange protein DsbE
MHMTRGARIGLAVGLVLIGATLAVFAGRFGINVEQSTSPVIGQTVPDIDLPLLDASGEINLATLDEQAEIVVVNFFASWCLQCRNEHVDLAATANTYADRSVEFVGIAFQNRDSQAIGFLDDLGRGETTYYVADPGSRAAIEFGVFGVPETVFIRNGEIVGKLLGESDALTLSDTIERILAGEAIGSQQVGDFQQQPDG